MLYEYRCDNGHVFERVLKLADYNLPQTCECGAESTKLISTPMIAPQFEAYESPIDGKVISSKKKRIDDLARNDCVPYEEGIAEESTRRMKMEEQKLERKMENSVDEAIEKMPARQKEALESEMRAGAGIEYGRY